MFKKISLVLIVCLVGLALVSNVYARRDYPKTEFPGGIRITPLSDTTQSDLLVIESPAGTTQFSVDVNGRVNPFNVTILDSYTDLSTWANASSGQSYYQLSAHELVIYDPASIYLSSDANCGASCGTGFQTTVFSGVSFHAPLATAASDKTTFRVEYGISGVTGMASALVAGTTTAFVYGAPSAGVTDFAYVIANTNLVSGQNIQNIQQSAGIGTVPSDMFDSEISFLGDSKTWRLMFNGAKSSVSAYIVEETNL